jgi:thiazole synthase ThiGH ThiG subunit
MITVKRRTLNGISKPVWPCFPFIISTSDSADVSKLATAIADSETDVVIVNAPPPAKTRGHLPCSACLTEYPISHETFRKITSGRTIVLNINKSTCVEEAIEQIRKGLASSPVSYVKLEILDKNKIPKNEVILETIQKCNELFDGVRIIPFFFPDLQTVEAATQMGCVGVRLLAGRIAESSGVLYAREIAEICSVSRVPVVAEGGISSFNDIKLCLSLGTDYTLLTSAFQAVSDPGLLARQWQHSAMHFLAERE